MNPIILLVFAGVALAVTTFVGKTNGSPSDGDGPTPTPTPVPTIVPGTGMADIMFISGPNID